MLQSVYENKAYDEINNKTTFAKEKTGTFEAEGFFDGSIKIKINKKYIDQNTQPEVILRGHSAPITDIMFIVTHNYGATIQENTPTSLTLFLVSSSLDQTIIIWQLYEGNWSVAKRFSFKNSYCTSISADLKDLHYNEKIYFAFSDGETKYIDINDATKMIDIRKYDDAPICIAIDVNPSASSFSSDSTKDETIITGDSKGKMKSSTGEETELLKYNDSISSTSRILYIDIDPPYIVSTFENGKIFIIDRYSSETTEITPALVNLKEFTPIMAKFDKSSAIKHVIKILGDNGQIVTVMKFPNNTYQIIQ